MWCLFQLYYKFTNFKSKGIQALYGRKSGAGGGSSSSGGGNFAGGTGGTSARTTKVPTVLRDDALCTDSKIDAIFNTADGASFAFKKEKYFKLTENAVAEGYPKLISEGWPGLPSN